MQINEFLSFTRELMDSFGLDTWNLVTDNAIRRNGCCIHRTKTLSFSKHFIERNPQEMLLNTVLHEIAHALVGGGHGHNEVWRQKCIEIGYSNPTRCTASDMPKGKYQAHCTNCGPINAYKHRLKSRKKPVTITHVACGSMVYFKEVLNYEN